MMITGAQYPLWFDQLFQLLMLLFPCLNQDAARWLLDDLIEHEIGGRGERKVWASTYKLCQGSFRQVLQCAPRYDSLALWRVGVGE
jgi:hypothetical protein